MDNTSYESTRSNDIAKKKQKQTHVHIMRYVQTAQLFTQSNIQKWPHEGQSIENSFEQYQNVFSITVLIPMMYKRYFIKGHPNVYASAWA